MQVPVQMHITWIQHVLCSITEPYVAVIVQRCDREVVIPPLIYCIYDS